MTLYNVGGGEVSSDSDSGSEDEGDSGDEVPVRSKENIIAISCTNTTDASTQTLDTQQCPSTCRCEEVLKKLYTIMNALSNIGDELASHGSDIFSIQLKSEALQEKLEQHLVSHTFIQFIFSYTLYAYNM